jgi:hypothetical protein
LSAASDEFADYREQLRHDLTRPNVEVKIQEDFVDLGGVTLEKLDDYIKLCDAVVHLVGDMTGAAARERSAKAIRGRYSDLPEKLPPLGEALAQLFPIRNGRPGSRSTMARCCRLHRPTRLPRADLPML